MQRKLISLLLFGLLIVFTANQVDARPSYKQGFARSAGESAHPELWRGLVGAWVPSLGITGDTLFDQSAYKNNGTLTNMDSATDWVVKENGYVLDFDGGGASDDYVDLGTSNNFEFGTESFSIVARIITNNTTTDQVILGKDVNGARDWNFSIGIINDGDLEFQPMDSTANRVTAPITANVWHNVAATRSGASNTLLYIDGVNVHNQVYAQDFDAGTAVRIGEREFSGFEETFDGQIALILIYKGRVLSPNTVAFLDSSPLAMFELRPLVFKAPASAVSTFIPSITIY